MSDSTVVASAFFFSSVDFLKQLQSQAMLGWGLCLQLVLGRNIDFIRDHEG